MLGGYEQVLGVRVGSGLGFMRKAVVGEYKLRWRVQIEVGGCTLRWGSAN